MITYNGHVTLTRPIAKALLAFASKDATRPHLCGVGLTHNGAGQACLAATDGHTLVTFPLTEETPVQPVHWQAVFSRSYVEQRSKIAQAMKADVTLEYEALVTGAIFPPCQQVEPAAKLSAHEPIGFNPDYLARLSLVAKACESAGATLVTVGGSLDPMRFDCGNQKDGTAQTARVTIMPMRI